MAGVLSRMEKYLKVKVKGKKSEKLQEVVPELLKNTLLVMKTKGVLVQRSALGGDSLWELTWLHVNNIAPSLQSEAKVVSELRLKSPKNEINDEVGTVAPQHPEVNNQGQQEVLADPVAELLRRVATKFRIVIK
ncbi:hypothetical protein GH714_030840 [Hevea brasiliensis]|uniref:Uncharacterized protein n=1 Tax=Hevea brasiliensis TaxID=3981 RepID=A0A6A6LHS3_HEVBR|nr:hypothetical protein GH714_030840 [Hevea brasiliensis]